MLLTVNIGNSHIFAGIFDNSGKIALRFKISSDKNKTADEYRLIFQSVIEQHGGKIQNIDAAIIASVVPQLTYTLCDTIRDMVNITPTVVGPGVKTGFPIKIDSPAELGGDMVANTAAAIVYIKEFGRSDSPTIIVDMNTVTTVSAISKNGEYIGCSIFPGIQMSFDSMHGNTAQLPNVSLVAPNRYIGKNTQDSVRSGVIFGHAMLIDGFVSRFSKEMHCKTGDLNLIITGEYAKYILSERGDQFYYDDTLTLKGLYYIYLNNIK